MDSDIRLRIVELYTNLLNYTYMNYTQTNHTIQQIEQGLRELIRIDVSTPSNPPDTHPTNSSYSSSTLPTWNTRSNPIPRGVHESVSSTQPMDDMANGIFRDESNRHPSQNGQSTSYTNRSGQSTPYTNRSGQQSTPYTNRSGQQYTPYTNRTGQSTPYTNRPGHINRVQNRVQRQPSNRSRSIAEFLTPIFSTTFNVENLSPVVVRPSRTHIERATEQIVFEENMTHNTCPITQSNFQPSDIITRIRACGHCFMEESLNSWFQQSVRCPVCRYDIREYNGEADNVDISNASLSTEPITNDLSARPNNVTTSTASNVMSHNIDSRDQNITRDTLSNPNNSQNVDGILNLFTRQITDTLRDYFSTMDTSSNDISDGIFNFEYIIHAPSPSYSPTTRTNRLVDNLTNVGTSTNVNNISNMYVDDNIRTYDISSQYINNSDTEDM